jgi:Pyruvate/2-oxoacid:ferredoxin oxidoreductase delta subunit
MAKDWLKGAIDKRAEKRRSGRAESSLIVPINKALEASQKVLPGEQVVEILTGAKLIALQPCECRTNLNRCVAPKDTCIVLDATAESQIKAGGAKRITIDEAKRILKVTEDAGLVHLIINIKGWVPEAICSCCHCCCQELNALLEFGQLDAVLQSDYVVEKDERKCANCGKCIERCHFKAHARRNDKVIFTPQRCYGCGLCVVKCPGKALKPIIRETRVAARG